MALKEILARLKEALPIASEVIEQEPLSTYTGRIGRQRQAKEASVSLKSQYRREMLESSLFMVITGSQKEDFAKVAAENETFVVSSDDFYVDLVNRIPEELYVEKQAVANVFDVIGRHLEDKAVELEIRGYPMLLMKPSYNKFIGSKAELVTLVKEAVNEQVGAEIVGITAISSILNKAIEVGHAKRITPVAIVASDDQMALDLIRDLPRLTNRVVLINAGKTSKALKSHNGTVNLKEVNEKTVIETLTNISKSTK